MRIARARDQARPTLIGEVVPNPLKQYDVAIAEANQKADVNGEPQEPSGEPRKLGSPEFRHRRFAANRCKIAFVDIAKLTSR